MVKGNHQGPIVLVCRRVASRFSGGDLFNQSLLLEAKASGVSMRALLPEQVVGCDHVDGSVLLWDSLDVPRLAAWGVPRVGATAGLVIHFLPFEDPSVETSERLRWRKQFDRVVAQMDFIITTGLKAQARIQGHWPTKPCGLVIPGVSEKFRVARRLPLCARGHGAVQVVSVASLVEGKRLLPLLEILANCGEDWHWHVVSGLSEPSCRAGFLGGIEKFGVQRRVTLYDSMQQSGVAALFAEMDLFVSFSAEEVYGMALAEAAATGLPIVATDVGDASVLVRHGVTGWVFRVGDNEGFRIGLEALIRNDRLRECFRMAASGSVVRSWSESLSALLKYLEPWR